MSISLANPTLTINNIAVYYMPNSIVYTEGYGEYNQRAQTSGNGAVDIVFSQNVETKMSNFKFDVANTLENIDLAKNWKKNLNQNTITIIDNSYSRTITSAALISDFEVNLGSEGVISLEFRGNSAV